VVRAVLFDLDDTLFDHRHCARSALAGVRRMHPGFERLGEAQLEAAHAGILEELHLDVLAGRLDIDTARIERFRRLYERAGIQPDDDLAVRTAEAYRDHYIQARAPIEGAIPLLEAVRRHAQVVVVSNNLLKEQQAKMRDCGLDRYVDVLVVSEEAGVSKPEAGIFTLALERAQVRAAEAVMIGDSWANDIEGARRVGIPAIWFNRDGTPSPDPSVPTLHSLEPADVVVKRILAAASHGTNEQSARATEEH
jgi:putative hydrolase of the HAD superfamily